MYLYNTAIIRKTIYLQNNIKQFKLKFVDDVFVIYLVDFTVIRQYSVLKSIVRIFYPSVLINANKKISINILPKTGCSRDIIYFVF